MKETDWIWSLCFLSMYLWRISSPTVRFRNWKSSLTKKKISTDWSHLWLMESKISILDSKRESDIRIRGQFSDGNSPFYDIGNFVSYIIKRSAGYTLSSLTQTNAYIIRDGQGRIRKLFWFCILCTINVKNITLNN